MGRRGFDFSLILRFCSRGVRSLGDIDGFLDYSFVYVKECVMDLVDMGLLERVRLGRFRTSFLGGVWLANYVCASALMTTSKEVV